MWRCCLNPKVIAGLAGAGLLVWLISPAASGAALPLLLALICPLSMAAMAWRMRRGGHRQTVEPGAGSGEFAGEADFDRKLRGLREEIAAMHERTTPADRTSVALTRRAAGHRAGS